MELIKSIIEFIVAVVLFVPVCVLYLIILAMCTVAKYALDFWEAVVE